jgi:hypothetical protein
LGLGLVAQVLRHIGTLRETSLHASLKEWLAQPGDEFEIKVDRYVVDILRQGHVIEIQTGNFGQIRTKVVALLPICPVTLVYPLPLTRWIVREDAHGHRLARRKSPRRGRIEDLFLDLVNLKGMPWPSNFELQVLLTREERVLRRGEGGSWRRHGWVVVDRRLVSVEGQRTFHSPAELLELLPHTLPAEFTNRELADALECPVRLAQKMTYTLQHLGQLTQVGKRGRAYVFTVR